MSRKRGGKSKLNQLKAGEQREYTIGPPSKLAAFKKFIENDFVYQPRYDGMTIKGIVSDIEKEMLAE